MSKNPQATRPEKRALTISEFRAAYGPSRATIYKMMNAGTLRTVLVGGRRLIPVDVAEELLKSGEAR